MIAQDPELAYDQEFAKLTDELIRRAPNSPICARLGQVGRWIEAVETLMAFSKGQPSEQAVEVHEVVDHLLKEVTATIAELERGRFRRH